MTLESRELIRCRQGLERRLQEAQDELIEKTHKSLGVKRGVEEKVMEMAQLSLTKLAPGFGESLTQLQSHSS